MTLVPAAYSDVALLHVPSSDRFGNVQIDGIPVEDFQLAGAARRVIVSTEEIIDEDDIRRNPRATLIPFYVVDAVCHVPFGVHPCQMPYQYYCDEEHIGEWLAMAKTEEGTRQYLHKHVFEVAGLGKYLERSGGEGRMAKLRRIERLEPPAADGSQPAVQTALPGEGSPGHALPCACGVPLPWRCPPAPARAYPARIGMAQAQAAQDRPSVEVPQSQGSANGPGGLAAR